MNRFQLELSTTVKEVLESTGWTQRRLASEVDAHEVTVSDLKTGRERSIGLGLIEAICKVGSLSEARKHRLKWLWLEDRLSSIPYGRMVLKTKAAFERFAAPEDVLMLERDLIEAYGEESERRGQTRRKRS